MLKVFDQRLNKSWLYQSENTQIHEAVSGVHMTQSLHVNYTTALVAVIEFRHMSYVRFAINIVD